MVSDKVQIVKLYQGGRSAGDHARDYDFNDRDKLQGVVRDLNYASVENNWNGICKLLDLHAREIRGSRCGERKPLMITK